MPLLTIGIPTFNEVRHIRKTINAVVRESQNLPKQIEIIIVDNGSTDGTCSVLANLEKQNYPHASLRVIYNGANQGPVFSQDKIIGEAQGDYLWMIGGHDVILEGALKQIKDEIETKPDLIIVNALIHDELTDLIINHSLYGNYQSKTYAKIEEFFLELGGPSQALSCNIFNVQKLRHFPKKALVSQQWPHLEKICDLLIGSGEQFEAKFIHKPLIKCLIEIDGWQTAKIIDTGPVVHKEFGSFHTSLQLAEVANSKFSDNPLLRRSFTIFRDPLAIVRVIVIGKSEGLILDFHLLLRCIRAYKKSIMFWSLGLPILVSPRFLKIGPLLLKSKLFVHVLRRIFKIPIW